MALLKQEKEEIIKMFQTKDLDTGSSQVQIGLLTYDIVRLTEHFKKNKQDVHGRHGLIKKVNKRRSLLKYLKRQSLSDYQKVISELGLRK